MMQAHAFKPGLPPDRIESGFDSPIFSFQSADRFGKRVGWFRSSIVPKGWKPENHSAYEPRVALLRFNRNRGSIPRIDLLRRGRFQPGKPQADPPSPFNQ